MNAELLAAASLMREQINEEISCYHLRGTGLDRHVTDAEVRRFVHFVGASNVYIDDEYYHSNVMLAMVCFVAGLRSVCEEDYLGDN